VIPQHDAANLTVQLFCEHGTTKQLSVHHYDIFLQQDAFEYNLSIISAALCDLLPGIRGALARSLLWQLKCGSCPHCLGLLPQVISLHGI
jgi:hypothetical protein